MYRKNTKILSPLIFLLCFVFVFTACSGKEKLSEMSDEKLVKLIKDYGVTLYEDYGITLNDDDDISGVRDIIARYENDPNDKILVSGEVHYATFLKELYSFVDDYYK